MQIGNAKKLCKKAMKNGDAKKAMEEVQCKKILEKKIRKSKATILRGFGRRGRHVCFPVRRGAGRAPGVAVEGGEEHGGLRRAAAEERLLGVLLVHQLSWGRARRGGEEPTRWGHCGTQTPSAPHRGDAWGNGAAGTLGGPLALRWGEAGESTPGAAPEGLGKGEERTLRGGGIEHAPSPYLVIG